MKVNMNVSMANNGIKLFHLDKEKALRIADELIGVEGLTKITLSWDALPESKKDEDPYTIVDKVTAGEEPEFRTKIFNGTTPRQTTIEHEQSDLPGQPDHEPDALLYEIHKIKISDCTTKEKVPLEPELEYAETPDSNLWIRYKSYSIHTTWENIRKLEDAVPPEITSDVKLLNERDYGNRRTAVIKFIEHMRDGLTEGDAEKVLKVAKNEM